MKRNILPKLDDINQNNNKYFESIVNSSKPTAVAGVNGLNTTTAAAATATTPLVCFKTSQSLGDFSFNTSNIATHSNNNNSTNVNGNNQFSNRDTELCSFDSLSNQQQRTTQVAATSAGSNSNRNLKLLLFQTSKSSNLMSSDEEDETATTTSTNNNDGRIFISNASMNISSSTNNPTMTESNGSALLNLTIGPPFARMRLNQWHTNEEIFNILSKCNYLSRLASAGKCLKLADGEVGEPGADNSIQASRLLSEWLCNETVQRPNNGSVFLFDRRKVKNFKKDAFLWKRRKTGGANSVREDRMYLKINGLDKIYGCYSHSSIISTFHRRCYWLLDKPDLVLVHYLQTPNNETGECVINLNSSNLISELNNNGNANCANATTSTQAEFQLNKDELKSEIKAMLWPYYLSTTFISENLKSVGSLNPAVTASTLDDFLNIIVSVLLNPNVNSSAQLIKINLNSYLNQSTQEILSRLTINNNNNNNSNNIDASNQTQTITQPQLSSMRTFSSNISSETSQDLENSPPPPVGNEHLSKSQLQSQSFSDNNYNININNNNKKVCLSLESCSDNGGEKLMIIGNWSDMNEDRECSAMNNQSTLNNSHYFYYYITLNNTKINLTQLNKHVLECVLPKFDLTRLGATSDHQNSPISTSNENEHESQHVNYFKTNIYLYENDQLYCSPIPFKIKSTTNCQRDKEKVNLKNQFFLLDRLLMLSSIYKLNKIEYSHGSLSSVKHGQTSNENDLNFQKSHSQSQANNPVLCTNNNNHNGYYARLNSFNPIDNGNHGGVLLFEKRLCQLIENLTDFIVDNSINRSENLADTSSSNNVHDFVEEEMGYLNGEHEGKTLLHMCCESGFGKCLDKLIAFKYLISSCESNGGGHRPYLNIIKNELKLFKLDKRGYTPMMLACKNGHSNIAMELFRAYAREFKQYCDDPMSSSSSTQPHGDMPDLGTRPGGEVCSVTSTSWYFHMIKSIEEANRHNHVDLANRLNDLLNKFLTNDSSNRLISAQKAKDSSSLSYTPMCESQMVNNYTTNMFQNVEAILYDNELNLHPIPSPNINAVIDEDFRLIENLDDLSSILADDTLAPAGPPPPPPPPPMDEEQSMRLKQTNEPMLNELVIVNSSDLTKVRTNDIMFNIDADLIGADDLEDSSMQPKPAPQQQQAPVGQKSSKLDDDQDKKIKTLADNIIAAMPHKIKTNSYSNSVNNLNNPDVASNVFRPINVLRRDTISFDDNYDPGISLSSCYSSSTRSSISPTWSLSYQLNNGQAAAAAARTSLAMDENQFSPEDESTCSSTFHIDSPPSTAEFCQYFHASSSSSYKNAIETGFAQLTLTDDEQRELYEAALIIQNAYRRYILRKKKKIRLDESCTNLNELIRTNDEQMRRANQLVTLNGVLKNFPQHLNDPVVVRMDDKQQQQHQQQQQQQHHLSRSTSLSSIESSHSYSIAGKQQQPQQHQHVAAPPVPRGSLNANVYNQTSAKASFQFPASHDNKNFAALKNDHNFSLNNNPADRNMSDDDENNSSSGEDQRQYQAACIIQKYYRRYKQYENLQKYTEAAVKIQTRYRAYKSASLGKSKAYQYKSNVKYNGNKLKSHYHHNSIDETSIVNSINYDANMMINDRRLIGSDLQLNNHKPMHMHGGSINQYQHQVHYPELANQKQIARKLINMRQSLRYSPASTSASTSSSSPISPASASQTAVVSSSFINSPPSNSNSQFDQIANNHYNFCTNFNSNNPAPIVHDSTFTLRNQSCELQSANNMTQLGNTSSSTGLVNSDQNQSFETNEFVVNADKIQQNTNADSMHDDFIKNLAQIESDIHNHLNQSKSLNSGNFDSTHLTESNFWTYLTKASFNLKNNIKSRLSKPHKTIHLRSHSNNFSPADSNVAVTNANCANNQYHHHHNIIIVNDNDQLKEILNSSLLLNNNDTNTNCFYDNTTTRTTLFPTNQFIWQPLDSEKTSTSTTSNNHNSINLRFQIADNNLNNNNSNGINHSRNVTSNRNDRSHGFNASNFIKSRSRKNEILNLKSIQDDESTENMI